MKNLKKPTKPKKPSKPKEAAQTRREWFELYKLNVSYPNYSLPVGEGIIDLGKGFFLMTSFGVVALAESFHPFVFQFSLESLAFYRETEKDSPEWAFLSENDLVHAESCLDHTTIPLLVKALAGSEYHIEYGGEYDPLVVMVEYSRSPEEVRQENDKLRADYEAKLAAYNDAVESYPRLLREWEIERAKAVLAKAQEKLASVIS